PSRVDMVLASLLNTCICSHISAYTLMSSRRTARCNRRPTSGISKMLEADPWRADVSDIARIRFLISGSGNSLSREAFQELTKPTAPGGVEFFKLLVRTTIALEEQRAGLLSTVSRNTAPDPVALLRHWLDAHALGHLALLSFRGDLAWFA